MFPLLSCVLLVLFIICQAGFVEEIAQEIIESPNVEDDTSIAGTHESRGREAILHSELAYWITTIGQLQTSTEFLQRRVRVYKVKIY